MCIQRSQILRDIDSLRLVELVDFRDGETLGLGNQEEGKDE
jgi:hypothetical protein